MADNLLTQTTNLVALPVGTAVATRSVTYSGDANQHIAPSIIVEISGSDDAKVATDVPLGSMLGSTSETPAVSSVAVSGLNGLLRRIINLLPTSLTGSGNLKVAIVEDTVGGLVVTDASTITAGQASVPVVEGCPFTYDGSSWKRGGFTPFKLLSAATTNGTSVKGAAGTLGMCVVTNTNSAVRYLKFYNKATAPTVGTDTPVLVIAVPGATTGGGVAVPIPSRVGVSFTTGIALAITTGAADTDTGAVALNEVIVNLGYM